VNDRHNKERKRKTVETDSDKKVKAKIVSGYKRRTRHTTILRGRQTKYQG
jgi:hypothetical protein